MKKIIIDLIKKYKWYYIIISVLVCINIYLSTFPSKITGWIIDLFYNIDENKEEIIKNIIFLVFSAVGLLIIRIPWKKIASHITRDFEKNLKDKIFEHFLKIKLASMQNIKNGELMSYLTQDVTEIKGFFYRIITLGSRTIATAIIVTYTMMNGVNVKLTLITLCPIIIATILVIKIKKLVAKSFKTARKHFTVLSEYVQESTDAIKTIKAYSNEKQQLKTFIKKNNALKTSNITVEMYSSLLDMTIKICFGLCYGISLIYGSRLVLDGLITIGEFTAFNGYIGLFVFPVKAMPILITRYKRAQVSYKRLESFFALEKEKILVLNNSSETPISGDIEIKNLDYNYPTTIEVALKNINLNIKQGSTLGIIGTIGSGKTTLANLLLKLYTIPDGKIFIGGRDINDISLADLRKSFCYITQDNFLFSTTLKDNITLFNEDYSDEVIEESTKNSMIYGEIENMQNGIDTVIGEKGIDLSGGQKQRVAISRAFVKRSNFIIFDDAFSALDNKTEQQVLDNVKNLSNNKTCIIISNRISDIKDADNIIVLDDGKIVGEGTHEQLLSQNSLYIKFYKKQSSQEAIELN